MAIMDASPADSWILSVQRLQDQALESFGFVVKNTFIEDEGKSSPAAARRASSAPAMPRLAPAGAGPETLTRTSKRAITVSMGSQSMPVDKHCRGGRSRSPGASNSSRCCSRTPSPASTAYHSDVSSADTDTPFGSFCRSPTGSPPSPPETATSADWDVSRGFSWADTDEIESEIEEEDPSAELAALVESKCSFLRLMGQEFYNEVNEVRRKRGVVKCVVFYVRGLPWAKRAKWLLPLLWAVAKVLNAQGCTTKVQAGEMYAQLPGARGHDLVRLDFAAARSGA